VKAAYKYWQRIVIEENCRATLKEGDGWFEFRMHRCPSLSKVLDNDAEPSPSTAIIAWDGSNPS